MKQRWIVPALVLLLCVVAYCNSFNGPFIFDDLGSIPENPYIRSLLGPWWETPGQVTVGGRPAVAFTLAVNYAIHGLDVRGYHVVNLLLHMAAALVLYELVRGTLLLPVMRGRYETAAPLLAGFVAAIWAVHPLVTDTVTYLIQRTELMMGLSMLLTLWCVLRSTESRRPGVWHLAAVLACAVGMGSKETMVVAPIVAWLYDRTFLAGSFWQALKQRPRLYLGLAGTWVLLGLLVAQGAHSGSAGFHLVDPTPWQYLLTQSKVIWVYLKLSVWPHPLVLDYADWPIARSLAEVWPWALATIAAMALSAVALWRWPKAGFLAACFWLVLGPTSSVLPLYEEAVAERRMYIPLAAVVLLVGIAVHRWLPWRRALVLGAVAVVLLVSLTLYRNAQFQSDVGIYADTVAKRPNNYRARGNLGSALLSNRQFDSALPHLQRAVELKPSYSDGHNNLGALLIQRGDLVGAQHHLERALKLDPSLSEAYLNLGNVLYMQGQTMPAITIYQEGLKRRPDLAKARLRLGLMLQGAGRSAEAAEQYRALLQIDPGSLEAMNNLAWVLATDANPKLRNGAQALKLAQHVAKETQYRIPDLLDTLAAAHAEVGDFTKALAIAQRAQQIAQAAGNQALAKSMGERVALYRAGRHIYDR